MKQSPTTRISCLPLRCLSLLFLAVTANAAPLATAKDAPAPAKAKIPMAMNLGGITDYSGGFPFRNLMWGARPWLSRNQDGKGPHDTGLADKIPLDANGYPLELPFKPEGASQPKTLMTIIPNGTEPGKYVVLYEGEGVLTVAMSSKLISSEPGRVVIELAGKADDSGYEGIAIKSSVKGNHVRNIRILRLEDEKADLVADPFRLDFLTYCRQWHALRFMDWACTNNSLEKEWRGRKPAGFYTMVGSDGDAIGRWGKPASEFSQLFSGGVALEIMIQLANLTNTDPWLCVPHRATAEYRTEMAKMVKSKLNPKLKVYVEYSNEVWNWQFQQAGWMLQSKAAGDALVAAGRKAWKEGVVPEFSLDGGAVAKDGGQDHPERMGALDRICFTQWEEVFSGADRARLVRVIAVQHGWLDTVKRTVEWVMAHGGADAVAPAGYFGPNDSIYARWETFGAALTADQVIGDMHEALEQDSAPWTRQIGQIAKAHKLRYIVYEGGQHIQPKGQEEKPYMPALKAAQFSQGMYDVYMKNFAVHQEVGCDLFAAFSSIGKQGLRWGSWGHQEFYGQPRSAIPKYGALLDTNTPRK